MMMAACYCCIIVFVPVQVGEYLAASFNEVNSQTRLYGASCAKKSVWNSRK